MVERNQKTVISVHCTKEWRAAVQQLALDLRVPTVAALLEEAVVLVAEAAGVTLPDRQPPNENNSFASLRADRSKLDFGRVAESRN